jgi:DNA-directed RNA polymerase subunit RPC12/RpoP
MSGYTIIARQASDYLLPGYMRGYFCSNCRKEVQLSPKAACMVASGADLRCNTCGFPEVQTAKAHGVEVVLSTMAAAQLETMEEQAKKQK